MSNSFDKYDNKHTCTRSSWRASLPFAVFPQRPTKEGYRSDFEPDTMSSFQKTPVSHWRVNAYSALSFDRIYCYVLLFSWANKNSLFWRLLNACQIARPVLVSSLPNWKKPYNGHLISLVFFFGPYCKLRILVFFPSIYGPSAKSMEKDSVRNLQRNQTTMRWSRVSQAYHFLRNLANCVDSMLFHCFYDA